MNSNRKELIVQIEGAVDTADRQLKKTLERIAHSPDVYPSETDPQTLKWDTDSYLASPGWWTSGFFPGCLWMMHLLTDGSDWREAAHTWTLGLEHQKERRDLADMCGIISFSFGTGFKITGDEGYIPVLDTAAATFCEYFRPQAGAVRCWEGGWSRTNHAVVTDFLSFTELLFLANRLTGNLRYVEIANTHIRKTGA